MLELIGVSKVFGSSNGRSVTAVEDVDMTVGAREFVCILGTSGCGKTTILRLIAGLDVPTEGKILLEGKEIEGPGSDRCVVFQRYTLFPWRTVRDNVAFPLEIRNIDRRRRRIAADKYLRLVRLDAYGKSYPSELSGGMQQRVAVARALAADPRILLMDEPFGALDSRTREDLQNELIRIWECEPKTILFVTHSINEAIALADRVVVMTSGPGRIREELIIDLPRPRDRQGERFQEYHVRIARLLQEV